VWAGIHRAGSPVPELVQPLDRVVCTAQIWLAFDDLAIERGEVVPVVHL